MKPTEIATVAGFKFAWWCGRRLPLGMLRAAMALFAQLMISAGGASWKRLVFNEARVLSVAPQSSAARVMARRAMRNYFRYWAEMFGLSRIDDRRLRDLVEVRGRAEIDAALASGRGVLVVGTHSGNWDWTGAWGAVEFGGITTVAERLEPVELFDAFVAARNARNITILPHRGGSRPPSVALAEQLNAGKVAGLVADRDLSRHGVPVTFFGQATKMPVGPVRLARETGCLLVPAGVYYAGSKVVLEFRNPIDAVSGTEPQAVQRMADALAEIVRSHPECWFMLQQLWLEHPREWGGRG